MTTSAVMTRHTTFRYCLDPTVEQRLTLARHAGASRFAYNQCLNLHLQARADKQRDTSTVVPWTRFELINRFNAWKKSEAAGRVIAVDGGGSAEVVVTGLSWRSDVRQQVFEEAGADLATALKAWTDSRKHKRAGVSVGYPRFKKAFMRGLRRTRRLAKSVMRKQQGSRNRQAAAARLARHHRHMANTHDRLVVENLNVAGMLRNRRLSRAISDAGWARFVRLLEYKQRWRRGTVLAADRWFPSSKTCSACGAVRAGLDLAERIYHCPACGVRLDRDLNAAVNLAAWAETGCAQARDLQAWGPVINAHRQERSGRHHDGETDLDDVGTDVHRVPAQ
ncbi:RNA-guided endonuclease InsQ/TnpB family protein [Nocardia asteroides]|uniref:RNA-guided endonuclease InsQ/TnpB family protein n=1 Tax=Nocardia asteroides TaxID=1824 RepID=UPI003447C97C